MRYFLVVSALVLTQRGRTSESVESQPRISGKGCNNSGKKASGRRRDSRRVICVDFSSFLRCVAEGEVIFLPDLRRIGA